MKKKKIKKTTERLIEDLAIMVQKGFTESAGKLDILEKHLTDRLDRIEFNTNTHERRIEILEDKVRMISTKIGLTRK